MWGVRAILAAAVLALGAYACASDTASPRSAGDASGNQLAPGVPTFYADVEPLLRANCVSCHQDGGVAPFVLTNYAAAQARAPSIAAATRAHRMPPWPAASDAECPSQVDARRISESDIALLEAWASAGAPSGNAPATLDTAPAPVWGTLHHVDAVLRASEPYLPLLTEDDHRCFVLDPQLDADAYLVAYAVHVDVPGIVHHVQLWAIDDADAEATAAALDESSPGAGYPCSQDFGVTARFISVWAPSDPIRRHPPGTGMRLRAGHRMVAQIHYYDRGVQRPDHTAIELELEPHVEREADFWTLGPEEIELPPGQTGLQASAAYGSGDAPYQLWGVRAHMHLLGASARVMLDDGSGPRCLLSIPRWDPAWQMMYFYEQPIALPPGSELSVTCTYDTTSRDQPVRYGIRTQDEMCYAYFYVTP